MSSRSLFDIIFSSKSTFKNKRCLSRENQSSSLCKSAQILSDLQTLIKHSFLLYFPHTLLMSFLKVDIDSPWRTESGISFHSFLP